MCQTLIANIFDATCDVIESSHIRASRQSLEEESGMRRQRDAITGLLKDTARRSQQAETSKGGEFILIFHHNFFSINAFEGLVILEATYGSVENGDGAKDLVIDVTIPLQALVRNSQLCIPSSQTKVSSFRHNNCLTND